MEPCGQYVFLKTTSAKTQNAERGAKVIKRFLKSLEF